MGGDGADRVMMPTVSCHAVAAAMSLLTVAVPAASAQFKESFPDTPTEAMVLYESDADSWLKGPVQYALLEVERDAFKALGATAQRARFIAEFWERRDHDLRDRTNPYKIEFYTRVAAANDRYNEYPKGWKSDRGQIHILFGKPDFVRFVPGGSGRATVWTYRTIGPQGKDSPVSAFVGEFQIVFVQSNARQRYEVLGSFGAGHFPLYLIEAMEWARLAALDPAFSPRTIQ